jgi:LysM repeat protein
MSFKIPLVILVICLLCSCSQATFTASPSPLATGKLTPFLTMTPSPDIPTATYQVSIPVTPQPTATPFLHTITKDDTMLGIAFHYGISLEELQVANPGVDPHFLSVGKTLVIPLSGEIPQTLPSPTPVAVQWEQPRCYRSGDGGAWCLMTVHNNLETGVENLSAWIGLFSRQDEVLRGQVAYAPINMLPAGRTFPLVTYFPPPLPVEFQGTGELLSGISLAQDDARYLDIQLDSPVVEISTDGQEAVVRGTVMLPEGAAFPTQLWVLAVAYDSDGTVVGWRKWESAGGNQYALTVYSLVGPIDEVETIVEVRP